MSAEPPVNPSANPPKTQLASPGAAAAQQLAERVRDTMFANDHAVRALGMQISAVGPGTASVTMPVRQDMVNGHAICHGGLIATLADSAFAYACNARNEVTVASGFAIELLAPAKLGDVLTASCTELSRSGRTGLYDTEVHNQHGQRIALFRGRSHSFKGQAVVPD